MIFESSERGIFHKSAAKELSTSEMMKSKSQLFGVRAAG